MSRRLSTAEAARILGLRESRIRELVRSGLGRPAHRGHRYSFSFQDLVILRAAAALIEKRVPTARVARALAALHDELPEDRSISAFRIFADGRRVAVCDGATRWNPETGQTLLDLDVADLARGTEQVQRVEPPVVGEQETAEDYYERALELEDDDPVEACECYGRAISLDPDLADAYVNLGRLAHEAGDVLEAVRIYELGLERRPGDPVAHFNLALAVEDLRGPAAAVRHYQSALALDPDFADAHYNLAAVSEKLGLELDAVRHYSAYRRLTEPG